MNHLVISLSNGHIGNIEECATHGLATQRAHSLSEGGVLSIVVPESAREDVEYLCGQIKEKRENGFIREYGIVPNGTRSKGEGARTLGRMIYPAFGGRLEGEPVQVGENGSQGQRRQEATPVPLTFSSKRSEIPAQKIGSILTILPRRVDGPN